jgi:cobalamin-dependent methionine synthase I
MPPRNTAGTANWGDGSDRLPSEACQGRWLIEVAHARGVPKGNVSVDPLAMTLASSTDGALDTMCTIRRGFPDAHLALGLSNISFGLPARLYVNQAVLTLALAAGLGCVILALHNREMRAALSPLNVRGEYRVKETGQCHR